MSEDLGVDPRRQLPDDTDRTAVRPALADDLLGRGSADPAAPAPVGPASTSAPPGTTPPPDDDLLADEEFLTRGGQRPSRLTRALLVLLILAVGLLIGVQVGKAAGGSAAAGAGAGAGQSRRFGPPRAGASGGGSSAAPRSTLGSTAPAVTGTVTSAKNHLLLVKGADGATHPVTYTDDTTVTKPYAAGAIGAGDAVTVFGSRAADGSVNATSIVER